MAHEGIDGRSTRAGEVVSATPSGGAGLGDEVVSCLVRRVQSANFNPPEGGGASIVIPITFALQK